VLLLATVAFRFLVQDYLVSWAQGITYEDKVRRLVEKVDNEISRLRGFASVANVTVRVVSIEFFKSDARESLKDDPQLIAEETLYRALLMVPKDFSLLEQRVDIAGVILAAAAGRTIYVVKEYFNPDDEGALGTIAHEYTHVLQFVYQPHHDTETIDSSLVWSAVIEGEATLVSDLYITSTTGRAFSPHIPEPAAQKPFGAGSGWVLDRLFYFPYEYGEDFVYQFYKKKGWEAVNELYTQPPLSSTQILHLGHTPKAFQPISISNTKPFWGNWSTSYSETLGEYSIQLLLLQSLNPNMAKAATSGWMGDNATVYINNSTYLLQWQSVWENEESASNFATTLSSFFQNMGGVKEQESYWNFESRLITIKRNGQTVILVGSSHEQLLFEEIRQLGHP